MLAVSNDLIDMMHEHPLLADGGPRLEFEMVFPRPGAYRVWVQFQSAGIVNTVTSMFRSWPPVGDSPDHSVIRDPGIRDRRPAMGTAGSPTVGL